MAKVFWPQSLLGVLFEMPDRERDAILEKVSLLEKIPRRYPVRMKGRFRNHRWFLAQNWVVYYRASGKDVFIRGLWPARLP